MISILAALLIFGGAIDANAQLTIGKKSEGIERMATLQQMWAWLYKTENGYFYVCKTTNQFDDSMWLDLGRTKEDAVATVSALIETLDGAKSGDNIEIESLGEKYLLICEVVLGAKSWDVRALDTRESYAGSGPMAMSALKKALKELQK